MRSSFATVSLSLVTFFWIFIISIYCQNDTDFPIPPLFSDHFNDNDSDDAQQVNSTVSLNSTSSTLTTTTTTTTIAAATTTTSTITAMSSDLPKLSFEPFLQFRQLNYNKNFTDRSLSEDRGMWMLYEITDWFLNRVQPTDFPDCKCHTR